jgi:hypothetical protein
MATSVETVTPNFKTFVKGVSTFTPTAVYLQKHRAYAIVMIRMRVHAYAIVMIRMRVNLLQPSISMRQSACVLGTK